MSTNKQQFEDQRRNPNALYATNIGPNKISINIIIWIFNSLQITTIGIYLINLFFTRVYFQLSSFGNLFIPRRI